MEPISDYEALSAGAEALAELAKGMGADEILANLDLDDDVLSEASSILLRLAASEVEEA